MSGPPSITDAATRSFFSVLDDGRRTTSSKDVVAVVRLSAEDKTLTGNPHRSAQRRAGAASAFMAGAW
jgi:hypothetical protein